MQTEREITVKLKWSLDEAKLYFVNRGISLNESFILKDIYLVKENMNLKKTNNLNILSSSIILREVCEDEKAIERVVMYKDKKYSDAGDIISETKYKCEIGNIESMQGILDKIGYKELFRYEQECLEYGIDNKRILLQYIPDLGLFAELEDNNKSVEQLINDLNELNIPYYENDYFVKKASLMIDKIKKQKKVK